MNIGLFEKRQNRKERHERMKEHTNEPTNKHPITISLVEIILIVTVWQCATFYFYVAPFR